MKPSMRIIALDAVVGREAGGKAEGLALLMDCGLAVPWGFVIVGLTSGDPVPKEVFDAFRALGGPVAVRSSAMSEDGRVLSYAGQFETVLGVVTEAALADAIEHCLASVRSERARAYDHDSGPGAMAVIVQSMVDARAAGVLFTSDPVTGDASLVRIEAVAGRGDALVSGHACAQSWLCDREGRAVHYEQPDGGAPLVDAETRVTLVAEALCASERAGRPLDLEWAIARNGTIQWLQARPITASGGVEPLAPPHSPALASHLYTRANIGEMLPGVVTPLTWSVVFGRSLENAMRDFGYRIGSGTTGPDECFVLLSHGQLFLDLTIMRRIPMGILGSTPEAVDVSIVGRPLRDYPPEAPLPFARRAVNTVRYVHYMASAARRVDGFEARWNDHSLRTSGPAADRFRAIDAALPWLDEAFGMHLNSSGVSGAVNTLILNILTHGAPPDASHHAMLSRWLQGADGIEGVLLMNALAEIARAIENEPRVAAAMRESPSDDALAVLRDARSSSAARLFVAFLARHGHRGLRESELREREWAEAPESLVARLRGLLEFQPADRRPPALDLAEVPSSVRWLVPLARRAVARRERSKSLLVRTIVSFKRAYRGLAIALRQEGRIGIEDDVFFFTHDELGALANGAATFEASAIARARRRWFLSLHGVELREVNVGEPQPIVHMPVAGSSLQGTPVCPGIVEGWARVALTPSDAESIAPGEVLIVPHTDVGWTPLFHRAAALATDVGSPLSHGAVVAREHGLPTVVNLGGATRWIRNGDRVRLDGARGILERLESTA